MMRFGMIAAVLLVVGVACGGGGAPEFEVVVSFNTSATQDDIDEVGDLLRSYDKDLEFLIQESFPPTGRAFLSSDVANFCRTVEPELEAKSYVDDVTCEER